MCYMTLFQDFRSLNVYYQRISKSDDIVFQYVNET